VTHLAQAGDASVEEQVGRYRELAEAGVQTAVVGLGAGKGPDWVSGFGEVIAAFDAERRA
jgi:hypothetical protein